jgi:protein involved in polysaccharide export with SLBB domain
MLNFKSQIKFYSFLFFIFIFSISNFSVAQTSIKPNFSSIRIDELSDEQLKNFIRQVDFSGLNDAQIEKVAGERGMKPEEIKKLMLRVKDIKSGNKNNKDFSKFNTVLIDPLDTTIVSSDTITLAEKALLELKTKIFGLDLFRNKQITFEPNLRLAAPLNYQIGPDDILKIELYGESEVAYSLKVSPEGNINIPNIGIISLLNTSLEQASERIGSKMSALYPGLRNKKTFLNVTIENLRTIKVIITGEVENPGTYSLSSVASVFNALYSSGGPTENGSFRSIEIIRDGKLISVIDVYDFLMKGDFKNSIRLQDQDVILVPPYKNRVELIGEVKRPLIFEIIPGENLNNLIDFAGGFTEQAYKGRIKVRKNTEKGRKIEDVFYSDFINYLPESGDKFYVDAVLDRFENRVIINGAVFRPGEYELESGETLSSLLIKAEGLREDAFTKRGQILRKKDDLQIELISFDVSKILTKEIADISLKIEDIVTIFSKFDLKEEYNVFIDGEVLGGKNTLRFYEGMTLEDAIILSGGITDAGSSKRVSVSRRVKNSDVSSVSAVISEVFDLEIDKEFSTLGDDQFLLEPFDIITVRSLSGYKVQRQMSVEGEVFHPGSYTLLKTDEKISSIIKRAGGLTAFAYPEGASLKRSLKMPDKANDITLDSIKVNTSNNDFIGIDLKKILLNPGGADDIIVEENDVLFIPRQLQTIKINGQVAFPASIAYKRNKRFNFYISSAGGFSENASPKKSFIKYANGSTRTTKKILFYNLYPPIKPGAEIFVPLRDSEKSISLSEIIGSTTSLLTLYLLINSVTNSN